MQGRLALGIGFKKLTLLFLSSLFLPLGVSSSLGFIINSHEGLRRLLFCGLVFDRERAGCWLRPWARGLVAGARPRRLRPCQNDVRRLRSRAAAVVVRPLAERAEPLGLVRREAEGAALRAFFLHFFLRVRGGEQPGSARSPPASWRSHSGSVPPPASGLTLSAVD